MIPNAFYNESRRRLVCRICKSVINDHEPNDQHGEFNHPTQWLKDKHGKELAKPKDIPCPYAGRTITLRTLPEGVELFARKRVRRAAKRVGAILRH
jgi:hypothetical protein